MHTGGQAVALAVKRTVRRTLGHSKVRRIKSMRTRLSASLNVGPWRRPGLEGMDVLLADALAWQRDGTFLELGGNDGFQASNTYLLERELGWRGVLIEAIPQLAAEARHNRPLATVVCAVASGSTRASIVGMDDQDLTSKVTDGAGSVLVATTTLSTVIDLANDGCAPDLLSIDVEGHEAEVLAGLDLKRHRPQWILVETDHPRDIGDLLGPYALVAQLSHHDYLFALQAPAGGGSAS